MKWQGVEVEANSPQEPSGSPSASARKSQLEVVVITPQILFGGYDFYYSYVNLDGGKSFRMASRVTNDARAQNTDRRGSKAYLETKSYYSYVLQRGLKTTTQVLL